MIRAKDMALAVNGGDWDADYTEAQKRGWQLKADYCNAQPVTPQDAARVLLEGIEAVLIADSDGLGVVRYLKAVATPPQEKDDE